MAAHDAALAFGGRRGILSLASIRSAIGRPYNGYYRPIAQKAAALVQSLAQNHGFVDGNKRTTVYVMQLLLENSGYELCSIDHETLELEIEAMILAVASDDHRQRMQFEDLVRWFGARIVKKGG